ncbi:hypothetical protein GCM10007939_15930 [Amylibacter marinus]|uniref:Uncharacterized protein n=1 Tax=Amylibacter marinus TaxID=1475483 RepID=A0ABQ5VVF5_9RHOB|nr:hypothetical protein [Amylibacter marinus]GLQ35310.1 hypothetical protein GCM10007939_15930 [Amylibacter marinus]
MNLLKTTLISTCMIIPNVASAQINCEPPTQLICWGGYQCFCDSIREIEVKGVNILILSNPDVLKPVKVDAELQEAIKKAQSRRK